ncbi:MAG: galactokinase family protein [Chthonomonadales bacterium]
MKSECTVSAPGRICLFGEHQDYLGLPVIASAINLRIHVRAAKDDVGRIRVYLPYSGEVVHIELKAEAEYRNSRDYLRSAFNIVRRLGTTWNSGFHATIHGNIPINAGVSSSSALVVTWIRLLLEMSADGCTLSSDEIARLSYEAEVTEFQESGGMMDHYCAAVGCLLEIDTRPPFKASPLNANLTGIVLGNSMQPKATVETIRIVRTLIADGIRELTELHPDFDLAITPLQDVEHALNRLPTMNAVPLRANLLNRDLTIKGRAALSNNDQMTLGELFLAHHAQLRDGLGLSTTKIERILAAAMSAGALGGKINGSGGGGCLLALAPGREEQVAEAMRAEGAEVFLVHGDGGVRVEA